MNREPLRPELSISAFFPAYNEEANIEETIFRAEQVLRRITNRYELIIVDDGSTDKTKSIVENIEVFNPRIRLISHYTNLGYGAALIAGIRAAKYDWVFFTDADLQFRLEELERLVEYVPLYSVVIGHRAPRKDPFMRLMNAWGWNILNRALFDLKVKDIDCAFKLFHRSLLSEIPIHSKGAMISAEILIRLQRKGVLFKEIPVTHLPRTQGSPTGAKPAVIFRAFQEMIRLFRGDLGLKDSSVVQMGKYGMVGVVNTLFDIVLYFILTRYTVFFGDHILSAKLFSFMAGTVCSFVLNRRFTFAIQSKLSVSEIVKFYSSVGAAVVINVFTLYVFNNLLHMYDLWAVAISTVLTFVWGFLFSKFWVFNKVIPKKGRVQRKVAERVA